MGLDMYMMRYNKIDTPRPTMDYIEGLDLPDEEYAKERENFDIQLEDWKDKAGWVDNYAYWRKFNALHNYFCKKAGREINCEPFELDIDTIKEILDILEKIDSDHSLADSLLPTESGCFFGSLDYNEWYFNDVSSSKNIFKKAYEESKTGDYVFVYDAWW